MSEYTNRYVLRLHEIDETDVPHVGGKGAHLGALSRMADARVPAGFCVTTAAFARVLSQAAVGAELAQLSRLRADDRAAIRDLTGYVRRAIERASMPTDIVSAITGLHHEFGAERAYAVRSSATAEDLPTASFAGQQDSFLNVLGLPSLLAHISRCWASLYTERAVTYRLKNGVDQRTLRMGVVVQHLVTPYASGVLFTADPVTGNRKISSIDASFGLGEALVSGLVNPDVYQVMGGKITSKSIGTKRLQIRPDAAGGTRAESVARSEQNEFALTDIQVLQLVALGRKIEAHFGRPQDIEWCLVGDQFPEQFPEQFKVVQSRPITTLFPIPDTGDGENHVYVSVGHQQMMTDPMKPLGLSVWQLTTPRPMAEAGGRLFVDVTQALAVTESRAAMLEQLGKSDPLIRDALQSVIDRGDFIRSLPNNESEAPRTLAASAGAATIETDPALVADLIRRNADTVIALQRDINGKSGAELVDFIVEHIETVKRTLFDPRSLQVIMAAIDATWWLNEKLFEWLGEKNAADTLAQSVPNNVTSEMGLALLDVADAIRPHAEVVSFLERTNNADFLNELPRIPGGQPARRAIEGWLDKYGMRGVGEIDITRTRWSEQPAALLPLILGNIKTFEPGESARRFETGKRNAQTKETDLLQRLRVLPDGNQRANDTKTMIDRLRTFIGYREYPKYGMISRYFVYKRALMQEAHRLVAAGVLNEAEDIFYLRIQELQQVERTQRADDTLISVRKAEYQSYLSLRPPRVLTSDGEGISGSYRRANVAEGALIGLAVSAGIIEGRARVILDIATAELEPGDILVTAFTDPSWTPLFVSISGLVTEVGGLMTHGAVIAREYGLPAVVGVELATRRIRDGQRIRVDGTEGLVELLE